jgi:hypothetical protein
MLLYEIAYTLKTPLYKLQQEMPYDEFIGWMAYFDRRPLGWKEDLRTFYIMKSFGTNEKPENVFPSLAPVIRENQNKDALATLKGSQMLSRLLRAKGGVQLNFEDLK